MNAPARTVDLVEGCLRHRRHRPNPQNPHRSQPLIPARRLTLNCQMHSFGLLLQSVILRQLPEAELLCHPPNYRSNNPQHRPHRQPPTKSRHQLENHRQLLSIVVKLVAWGFAGNTTKSAMSLTSTDRKGRMYATYAGSRFIKNLTLIGTWLFMGALQRAPLLSLHPVALRADTLHNQGRSWLSTFEPPIRQGGRTPKVLARPPRRQGPPFLNRNLLARSREAIRNLNRVDVLIRPMESTKTLGSKYAPLVKTCSSIFCLTTAVLKYAAGLW